MEIIVEMKNGTKKPFNVNVGDSVEDIFNELNIEFGEEWLRWK